MSTRVPRHRGTLTLYLAAWVHLFRALAAVATLGLGAYAIWEREAQALSNAAICLVLWLIFALLHAFEATRANCAVCAGPLLLSRKNSKHRTARSFLGSYELRSAFQVVAHFLGGWGTASPEAQP